MNPKNKSKLPIIITRVAVFVGTLLLLFFICKFAMFFLPFLIAGAIALLIEPVIKFCMNKLKMSRRLSSTIVVTFTVLILGYLVVAGIAQLSSELIKLSDNIGPAITKVTETVDDLSENIANILLKDKEIKTGENGFLILDKDTNQNEEYDDKQESVIDTEHIQDEDINTDEEIISEKEQLELQLKEQEEKEQLENNLKVIEKVETYITESINELSTVLTSVVSTIIKVLLSVPTIIIYLVITILALVFFTKDRIYVIDTLEHHFPKAWLDNASKVLKEIFSSLGTYIKIYTKIILITFAEVFIVYRFIFPAFDIEVPYPLAFAIITAVVDILPVLGVGTILIPWALWYFVTGNIGWGFVVILTYLAITVIRNFIEPKLVSTEFGIHPLITLIAMYTGFRLLGVVGLLLGPITLMVLRCIFAKQIERGIFKDLFAEK